MFLELRRQYHCAAYNTLIAVVTCTQTEAKFYNCFLFMENLDKVCLTWVCQQFLAVNLVIYPLEIMWYLNASAILCMTVLYLLFTYLDIIIITRPINLHHLLDVTSVKVKQIPFWMKFVCFYFSMRFCGITWWTKVENMISLWKCR